MWGRDEQCGGSNSVNFFRPGRSLVRFAPVVLAAPLVVLGLAVAPVAAGATTTTIRAGSPDTNFNSTGSLFQTGAGAAGSVAVVPTVVSSTGSILGNSGDVVASFGANLDVYSATGTLLDSAPLPTGFTASSVAVAPNPASPNTTDVLAVAGSYTATGNVCAGTSPLPTQVAALEMVDLTQTTSGSTVSTALTNTSPYPTPVDCSDTTGGFTGVTFDGGGQPVATGYAVDSSAGDAPAVLIARFTTSGARDTTFGSSGMIETQLGGTSALAYGVAVAGSGSSDQIFATGSLVGDPFVAEFTYNATTSTWGPDSSFGSGGVTQWGSAGQGNAVVALPNGDVAVAGIIDGNNPTDALWEWTSAGTPDTSFGNSGLAQPPSGLDVDSGWSGLAFNPAGNLLIAAGSSHPSSSSNNENSETVVSEYNALPSSATTPATVGGSLNTSFGTNGSVVQTFTGQSAELYSTALAADGSVLAVGQAPDDAAPTGYIEELYGYAVSVAVSQSTVTTTGGSTSVTFTVTLDQALGTPTSTTLCYSVAGSASNSTTCVPVTIAAGSTTTQVTETVTASSTPGQDETVTATTVNSNGVGATTTSAPTQTTVETIAGQGYSGYWLAASGGGVYTFNTAYHGAAVGDAKTPFVAMAANQAGTGYWMVTSNGHVWSFGAAKYYGGVTIALSAPVVGMAATADGEGYWLVTANARVFAFGDANKTWGPTTGMSLNHPVVGMSASPDGGGYVLVTSSGAVLTYGDAKFHGAATGYGLTNVVGIDEDPANGGYWIVTNTGAILTYGTPFYGSEGAGKLPKPVVGMATNDTGSGYWLVTNNGGIFTFGHLHFYGSLGGHALPTPIVAIVG